MIDALLVAPTRSFSTAALALCVALGSGCGPAKDNDAAETDSDGSSGSTAATSSAPVTASGAMTAGADSTTGDDDAGGTVGGDPPPPADSSDDGGFIDMPTDGNEGGPQGLGAMCSGPDDCESGFCYSVPMVGSSCSECLTDSDCESGTCALDFTAGYAACTDGSTGVMCDSDEGCTGELICALVVDTGGLFPANFCSECDAELPCDGGQLCAPVYDTVNLGGSLQCLDAMSVPDGGGCPIGADGGEGAVCVSGFCGIADLFGVAQLGVCGACVTDEDCADPELTCTPPNAAMGGLMPAVCG